MTQDEAFEIEELRARITELEAAIWEVANDGFWYSFLHINKECGIIWETKSGKDQKVTIQLNRGGR